MLKTVIMIVTLVFLLAITVSADSGKLEIYYAANVDGILRGCG